ncbi:cupin domain-containing protein [Haloferula sargassicola]|uniref:Cupin type-2 domain-containing protein n=1 Tax=Haloferula sargassicola TaxID=490096 RepID=A0ABP9UHS3_9BACT
MPNPSKHFISHPEVVHETNDWTHNEWLCRPDIAEAERLLMVRARMKPRHCHPFHRHPHREEIIHVLEGRAEQWVGEERRILGPGEVAVIPPGVVHATYNPFDEPLVFHAILSPAMLAPPLDADPDPCDVSGEAPWSTLRDGLTPCTLLRDDQ